MSPLAAGGEVIAERTHRMATGALAQGGSIFNEAVERKWVSSWLIHANSTRNASAMGGADYGVFANGRHQLSVDLREMPDYVEFPELAREK